MIIIATVPSKILGSNYLQTRYIVIRLQSNLTEPVEETLISLVLCIHLVINNHVGLSALSVYDGIETISKILPSKSKLRAWNGLPYLSPMISLLPAITIPYHSHF